MPRCFIATAALATLALATPLLAVAQDGRAIPIPKTTLRGEVAFGQPPEVQLNGKPARLAPGVRIRDQQNMIVMSGALAGTKHKVNYTADTYGLLMDVWLLRESELAKPWPKSLEEAATWAYDPIQHAWIKP